MTFTIKPLSPDHYRRQLWKNRGGISTTIATEQRNGAAGDDWSEMLWQLGRTQITTSAPFSDLSGFERMQVVVSGRGLVLDTPQGEIDVRRPLTPVRYDGGTPIVSRLEDGPVEVVNLIANREACRIDLIVLGSGSSKHLIFADHIVYAPNESVRISIGEVEHTLPHDHSLHMVGSGPLACLSGTVLVASVTRS